MHECALQNSLPARQGSLDAVPPLRDCCCAASRARCTLSTPPLWHRPSKPSNLSTLSSSSDLTCCAVSAGR
eukprot:356427-Chlamydomonas_euryale.AAC.4